MSTTLPSRLRRLAGLGALATVILAPVATAEQPAGGDPWPGIGNALTAGSQLDWQGIHARVSANKYTLSADTGTGGGYLRIQYTSRTSGYDDSFSVRAGGQTGGVLLTSAAAFTVCDSANKVCAPGWTAAG